MQCHTQFGGKHIQAPSFLFLCVAGQETYSRTRTPARHVTGCGHTTAVRPPSDPVSYTTALRHNLEARRTASLVHGCVIGGLYEKQRGATTFKKCHMHILHVFTLYGTWDALGECKIPPRCVLTKLNICRILVGAISGMLGPKWWYQADRMNRGRIFGSGESDMAE